MRGRRLAVVFGAKGGAALVASVPGAACFSAGRQSCTGARGARRSTSTSSSEVMVGTLDEFAARHANSWVEELNEDPEAARFAPNKRSREVKSGHYVRVKPTPLTGPTLVMHSRKMASELGLSEEAVVGDARFARFFGGDSAALDFGASWATPYALSIMGEPMFRNCPFGNGNGYGDGRAISVGEVEVATGERWELQLKGAGQTPFCRGADGRAVLRSSLREFLASEAMNALGVRTTRALSLVTSSTDNARRAWYSKPSDDAATAMADISEDDPRLARFPPAVRSQLLRQLRAQLMGGSGSTEPDLVHEEQCAITCRLAPSFLRVGHIDLFSRRAVSTGATETQKDELRLVVRHAAKREFPEILDLLQDDDDIGAVALALVECVGDRIGTMVAEWLRVGFCQGNFNADNCLISGRTMDYGPFGFIDRYDPKFAKWVGSGDHFAFGNQPQAGIANFLVLVRSLDPLIPADRKPEFKQTAQDAANTFMPKVHDVWRRKLGFASSASAPTAAALFAELEPLLRSLDYTIAWRELATVAETYAPDATDEALVEPVVDKAAYVDLSDEYKARLAAWMRKWLAELGDDVGAAPKRLRGENPKYILREWMLVEAYEAAQGGDFALAQELHDLTLTPYAEHDNLAEKYYRMPPKVSLNRPGTAFMT